MKHSIALIGLSGSGKTTVAQTVATALGWRVIDTDHEIERKPATRLGTCFGNGAKRRFVPKSARCCNTPWRSATS